jgi:hypothetical protein
MRKNAIAFAATSSFYPLENLTGYAVNAAEKIMNDNQQPRRKDHEEDHYRS